MLKDVKRNVLVLNEMIAISTKKTNLKNQNSGAEKYLK